MRSKQQGFMWVIVCLITGIVGFIMFTQFREQAPDEVKAWLPEAKKASAVATAEVVSLSSVFEPTNGTVWNGWFVQKTDAGVQLTKSFKEPLILDREYVAPTLTANCINHVPAVWLNAQMPLSVATAKETVPPLADGYSQVLLGVGSAQLQTVLLPLYTGKLVVIPTSAYQGWSDDLLHAAFMYTGSDKTPGFTLDLTGFSEIKQKVLSSCQ